ncbi:MAG TPA: 6-phosphogluconolactonase, partial [Longimicrobiaceae bacterium]|nr:6-phosphogluconolactonase [Longimicrobiaceae bacterium]
MSLLERPDVQVHSDAETASRAAAERAALALRDAVEQRGVATIALSGGSTPEVMYRAFTDAALAIPWERVHLLWGDERCVPPAHPRSNFGMAWRAFISRIPIPAENIHRMRGELPPDQGAEEYRTTLREIFSEEPPTFDFV